MSWCARGMDEAASKPKFKRNCGLIRTRFPWEHDPKVECGSSPHPPSPLRSRLRSNFKRHYTAEVSIGLGGMSGGAIGVFAL
ncbi:uncharacterized protein VTP21DRAFT_4425 [Calcarisporiella thermophila]|uniref:uncharacterized protein n=1 Tax=Calcarisporiella thermophila TaxID=911321 RepID=UPI00374329B8